MLECPKWPTWPAHDAAELKVMLSKEFFYFVSEFEPKQGWSNPNKKDDSQAFAG